MKKYTHERINERARLRSKFKSAKGMTINEQVYIMYSI